MMPRQNRFYFFLLCLTGLATQQATAQHTMPKPGRYGDFMEVVTNARGEVTGKFDYQHNDDRCIFYFFSNERSGDTMYLRAGLPSVEVTSGMLVMHGDSLTLFTEFSGGFSPYNLRKSGYGARLKQELKALAVGIVRDDRCMLYSKPENNAALKDYFTSGNFVTILQRKGLFVQARHTNAADGITTTAWIKAAALFESDPLAW